MSKIHKYFDRKYSEWDIIDFLKECEKEPFESKVDEYVKSLDTIIKRKRGSEQGKARILLNKYRETRVPAEDDENFRYLNIPPPRVASYSPQHGSYAQAQRSQTSNPSDASISSVIEPETDFSENDEDDQEEAKGTINNKGEKRESPNYSIPSELEFDDASGSSSNATLDNGNENITKESLENDEDGFMNDHAKLEYQTKFLNMRSDKKWKLPSGYYVEDILYEYTKDLLYENQLHSFIIDTSNEIIMNLFNDIDKEHIITYNTSPELEISDELIDFLMRYRKFQPNEMREVVNSGINISTYDSKKHFNFHYIHQVFSQLLPRYELRPNDFTRSHLEGWFTSNVWSVIVDACFIDLETVEFIRGEGCSSASRQRKNRQRKCPKVKKIMGRKCDGIARDLGSPEEFAVSEEGCTWTGEDGTKYLSDGSLKMPKIMRDMLFQKIKNHGVRFVKNNQIEIVGFLHSAQYLQVLVMDIPSGYICRLCRYPQSKVPTVLSEVDDLISVVYDVLIAKLRITRCLGYSSNSSNEPPINNNETLKKRLKKKPINRRQENDDYDFPSSQKTPKKRKIEKPKKG